MFSIVILFIIFNPNYVSDRYILFLRFLKRKISNAMIAKMNTKKKKNNNKNKIIRRSKIVLFFSLRHKRRHFYYIRGVINWIVKEHWQGGLKIFNKRYKLWQKHCHMTKLFQFLTIFIFFIISKINKIKNEKNAFCTAKYFY